MGQPNLTLVHSDTWMPQDREPTGRLISTEGSRSAETIDIDALYPSVPEIVTPLGRALELLKGAIDDTTAAVDAMAERAFFQADDHVHLVHARLYELFAQREIGDGFGAIINACLCALEQRRGESLRLDQIQVIRRCLLKLRRQPMIDFHSAVDLINELESKGLATQPAAMEAVADLLHD